MNKDLDRKNNKDHNEGYEDNNTTSVTYKNTTAPKIDVLNSFVDGTKSADEKSASASESQAPPASEKMKHLEEMNYEFLPSQEGYFQLGTFLFQWGLCGSGVGGANEKPEDVNPTIAFGLAKTPILFTFGIAATIGFTTFMDNRPQPWETAVPLHKEYDEIFGAMAIPILTDLNDRSKAKYNFKVIKLDKAYVSFKTMEYHSPFMWFTYGYRARKEEKRDPFGILKSNM